MVEMINRIEKRRPNDRIILKDLKTGATKTYEIPVGKRVIYGKQEFDMSKVPNGQLKLSGENIPDSDFYLAGLALEHMDVNNDKKIDEYDSDSEMAGRLNRKLSSSKNYVKDVDCFSDAGIYIGEGGAIFSQDSGKFFQFYIENKDGQK